MAPTKSKGVAALANTIGTGEVQTSGEGTITGSGSPVSRGQHRSCMQSHLRKTKLCLYYPKGQCQYGDSCIFAHSSAELQSLPDLSKTRLCPACEQGVCTDKDCAFAHSEEELRSTTLFYKKNLCIWNEKGKCKNGDQCCFAHGTSELRRKQGGNRRQGCHGATPVPGKQVAALVGNEAKELKEPMKVLAVSCLPAPQPVVLPETLPAYAPEHDHTQLGEGRPAPGLPFPPDDDGGLEDVALPGAPEIDATWWQWPPYSMAAPWVPNSMLSMPGAGIEDMKEDLEHPGHDMLQGRCEPYPKVQRDPYAHEDDEPNPSGAYLMDADPSTMGWCLISLPGLLSDSVGAGACAGA